MFERCVKLKDGTIAYRHECVELTHRKGELSYVSIESDGAIIQSLNHELDLFLTFEDAEEWAKAQPEYAEYKDSTQATLDEVLEILTDEQAEQVPDAFPEWASGKAYQVGYRVRYESQLYKCIQAHTSQDGWEPPNVPALWVKVGEPGEIPEWVQPTGAHDAYSVGDKVKHNGKVWESEINANTYEPGVYGWKEVE